MFGPSAKRAVGGTPKTMYRKTRKDVMNAKQGWADFENLDEEKACM